MFLFPTEDLAADIKRHCRNMNAAEEVPACSSMPAFMCRKGFDVVGAALVLCGGEEPGALDPAGTEPPWIQTTSPASDPAEVVGEQRGERLRFHADSLCLETLTKGPTRALFRTLANY